MHLPPRRSSIALSQFWLVIDPFVLKSWTNECGHCTILPSLLVLELTAEVPSKWILLGWIGQLLYCMQLLALLIASWPRHMLNVGYARRGGLFNMAICWACYFRSVSYIWVLFDNFHLLYFYSDLVCIHGVVPLFHGCFWVFWMVFDTHFKMKSLCITMDSTILRGFRLVTVKPHLEGQRESLD